MQDPKSASFLILKKISGKDPRKLSFNEFLNIISDQEPNAMDCHWRPQVFETYIDQIDHKKILRFEELPGNIALLKALTRCEAKDIFENIENKSPSVTKANDKIREYYTDSTVELMQTIYAEDFKRFGYKNTLCDE